jgi:ribosome biogenesis GTPase A
MDEDMGSQEPDWEELCEYEPARESVYRLLDARDELSTEVVQIEEAMDKFHIGLEFLVHEIVQKIVDVFNTMEDSTLAMEAEIEHHFMDNEYRKVEYEKKVQQTAERAQQLFSNLLSGLHQSTS